MVIILTIITTFIISAVSFLIGYIFSSKKPSEAIEELNGLISAVKKDKISAIRPKTREDIENEEQAEADRMFNEAKNE